MKKFLRIFVGVASLAAVIGWTVLIMGVKDWRAPMAGMGDNAGASASGGDQLFDIVFIGALWLLPISPYVCMAAGAFNLISGKMLRAAYIYSLIALALMTVVMLISFRQRLELIALANIAIGTLWIYTFQPRKFSP